MVKRCLIKVDPLQAEQQLGFPAGATAGASSLDTAAPTVSVLSPQPNLSPTHYLIQISCWCPTCPSTSYLSPHSSTHLAIIQLSTFLVVQLTYQVPCIPNPEVESEAGGSSEDKDGQDGRKKKNRWVSQNLSLIFTLFGSHPFYRVTCIVVSPVCCFTCIIFNHPGAPPARRSLA